MYKASRHGPEIIGPPGTIPADPRNADYREYLEWVGKGGVLGPKDPDPVPTDEDKLNKTDQLMIRTLDWLLSKLVADGVINKADIPPKLRALYLERKALRGA